MGPRTAVLILVLCSARAIRVPIDWSESAVNPQKLIRPSQDPETFSETEIVSEAPNVQIPVEYFQYPANKPQFAVDVAAYHGVKNPEKHYSAYPVRPYTGKEKPVLGKHHIFDERNPVFNNFQQFAKLNDNENSQINPEYEVFHPYKAEEPALQDLYKDPVLEKIRNDIYNSQNRLQKYEKEAGQPDIKNGEYLESPEETDRKKFPHKNVPVPYEIHKPQRRPIYYRPSPYTSRDHYLNHKFRHPWNQHNAKIRPVHYRPLKHHLQKLRQNHATKFDDEYNQYPQVPTNEQLAEVSDGYDIYERGKAKYVALRNNVDESINRVVKQNRPETYQRLELQNNDNTNNDDENEFVPIKNYAQVRKTETTRHLPKSAALEDAVNFDEINNAPRLREAIKSTKAQTVYTEEGYEDAAYDHEGEEKHAAENEAHSGHLTEKEISGGKYKTPSESQKYEDASGNEYRDQSLHGEQWKDIDKDKEKEVEEEDYAENETEQSIEAEIYDDVNGSRDKRENEYIKNDEKNQINSENNKPIEEESIDNKKSESYETKQINNENDETEEIDSLESTVERSKRENQPESINISNSEIVSNADKNLEHDQNKRETNFKIPDINLNSTFLSKDELFDRTKLEELAKLKTQHKIGTIKEKYPYYYQNLKSVSKHSPLRYAENLKFIPQKTSGGTEFYDSRAKILECPEVDDEVDALPEKLKKDGHPDESGEHLEGSEELQPKNKADFSQLKKNRRLKGLGDKIDCFKAKFFGDNPLDSPFFKEDIISNPEPVTVPYSPIYKLLTKEPLTQASSLNNVFNTSTKLKENAKDDVLNLYDKLKGEQQSLQDSLTKTNEELQSKLFLPQNFTIISDLQKKHQSNVYSDVLRTINSNLQKPRLFSPKEVPVKLFTNGSTQNNINYTSYQNQDHVTKPTQTLRKRRSTPFVYEPYKIIKDGQLQESKKTTTLSNISPLIKQLQSSRIVDKVSKNLDEKEQPVKRNVPARVYTDIGRREREKNSAPYNDAELVEVTVDNRRGEPRYEVRVSNHKTRYVPVENKKSMTPEDYESRTNKTVHKGSLKMTINNDGTTTSRPRVQTTQISRRKRPTAKPFFDVSQFLPKQQDIQRTSASNTVNKVIQKPTLTELNNQRDKTNNQDSENDEEYEEYDDEEEITTTTTTIKPAFRKRRRKITTTTAKPEEEVQELPKLRLITRFNTTPASKSIINQTATTTETSIIKVLKEDNQQESPKYREKKKKSSESTLLTDTKTYNDGNEDMMKDEVDAMIGVQQNMEEYKPMYEKEIEERNKKSQISTKSSEEDESEEDDDEDHLPEDSEEFSDEEDESSDEDEYESSESSEPEKELTTPEPTKRTLLVTTEIPVSTTEARSAKLELKPIIHRKKIEIHKELPVNKSSPHITQFKQDIKEVEIIKEMPASPKTNQRFPSRRKPQKNIEALELYKDDKLAEEINKLGAVEVFKENLDLVKGPKHGGNYKIAHTERSTLSAKDPEASQSKNQKLFELTDIAPNRRSKGIYSSRNVKLELSESDANARKLHSGNLKSKNKNAKLIELDEEDEDNDSTEMHGGNFRSFDNSRSRNKPLHGGNYRNAKIIQSDETSQKTDSSSEISDVNANSKSKAAVLLNTFVQAIPHLTTTPAYILDPSKRMYYYVDA